MKAAYKIFFLVGAIFAFVGMIVTAVFFANRDVFGWLGLLPLIFVVVGIALIIHAIRRIFMNRKIVEKGKRISAKIYGYVEDKSTTVNGTYAVNTVVHYFDINGKECEAILETGFLRGSNEFPIGMTVDIYEYNGSIGYDKASVRSETIPREARLMHKKQINTDEMEVIAIECKNCGASFCVTKGYAKKCPYCGK